MLEIWRNFKCDILWVLLKRQDGYIKLLGWIDVENGQIHGVKDSFNKCNMPGWYRVDDYA
jgi:hypothetical protein